MDFRIIELSETEAYGIGQQFDGQGHKTREELRHIMWSDEFESIPAQLCDGQWNQLGSTAYDGVWYGVWQNGRYMIARDAKKTIRSDLEKCIISAGTYAAFKTKRGTLAWEELPKLFDLIFDSWLPSSEYVLRNDDIIEIYHLWTDHDMRNKNRYYEVWIPIKLKERSNS